MVALNWQSWDEGTMVNEAMFAGEQGWVLKPEAYRSRDSSSEPVPSISRETLDLKITILAGQEIPLPPHHPKGDTFHPMVKCEIHVDKPDGQFAEGFGRTKEGKYKLATKHKKSENPDWGSAGVMLHFADIQNVIEDLCFLRLVSSFVILGFIFKCLVRSHCIHFPLETSISASKVKPLGQCWTPSHKNTKCKTL
jgi:hypothetical protein